LTFHCNKKSYTPFSVAWHLARASCRPRPHDRARPPQRHGNGGRGQQPAPPQGASDKTSGSISFPMPPSASPGISPEPPAAHGPAVVPGLPQRHGNGGRGQQPAPPQGASDKTSGSISFPVPPSASTGISPEPPAVHGPLPGDDGAARLPSPVSMIPHLAASKRPAIALSPTDVALFPTSRAPPRAA